MPIELTCQGCQQQIRVADEHAGKKARCPTCQAINQVPSFAVQVDPYATQPISSAYSPQGAFSPTPDPTFAPQPAKPFGPTAPAANPFAADPPATNPYANPYQSPLMPAYGVGPAWSQPHRGPMILILGILGLTCFQPLAIVAVILGHMDLRAMNAGTMDPQGKGLTIAGVVLGWLVTGLFLIYIGIMVIAFAMMAVGGIR